MSNGLVPLGDNSDEELRQLSTAMRQYLATESEAALKTVLGKIGQNPGIISRIIPSALQKEEQRVILQKLRATAKTQEAMYTLYTDVQLEIARRQGNALVSTVELNLQAKLSNFALAKFGEVQQAFIASRQRFMEQVKPELEQMENYRDIPNLYELAHQSILEDQRVFFEIINQLREGFEAAVKRRIESLSK